MFDVGFTEILLIGIVSLVVIGPERLPAVAKTAGQWVAKLQRFVRGVKSDLASELNSGDLKKLIGDQREQIDELRTMVSSARKEFQSTAQTVVKSTKESLAELETSVNEAKTEVSKLQEQEAGDDRGTDTDKVDLAKPAGIEKDPPPAADNPANTAEPATVKRTGTTDTDTP